MPKKSIVIVGGGAWGLCTAFQLLEHNDKNKNKNNDDDELQLHILEASDECGSAASGRAGGFLARDWDDATAARGFALHAQWAARLDGAKCYDYRAVDTYECSMSRASRQQSAAAAADTFFAVPLGARIGSVQSTAQLHPKKFCATLEQRVRAAPNARIRTRARVLRHDAQHVHVDDGTQLAYDALVYTVGPWSPHCYASKAASIIVRTPAHVRNPATCLFFDTGCEVYVRPDGTVYACCGDNADNERIQAPHARATPSPAALRRLDACVRRTLAVPFDTLVQQACQIPCANGDFGVLPFVERVADNVWHASGGNVWGVLKAPAMAEQIAQEVLKAWKK